jgi:hypothetical protein
MVEGEFEKGEDLSRVYFDLPLFSFHPLYTFGVIF